MITHNKSNDWKTMEDPESPLTFALFRLCFSYRRRLRRRLRRGRGCRDLLGNSDGGGGSGCCDGSGVALEGVVGAELPPLGPQDGHHLWHGDLRVLLGNHRPGGEDSSRCRNPKPYSPLLRFTMFRQARVWLNEIKTTKSQRPQESPAQTRYCSLFMLSKSTQVRVTRTAWASGWHSST